MCHKLITLFLTHIEQRFLLPSVHSAYYCPRSDSPLAISSNSSSEITILMKTQRRRVTVKRVCASLLASVEVSRRQPSLKFKFSLQVACRLPIFYIDDSWDV